MNQKVRKRPDSSTVDVPAKKPPNALLSPTTKLMMKTCSPLPYAMYAAQAVLIDGIVFVGGGITNQADGVNFLVFKYLTESDKWYTLPPSPVTHFGLAAVEGKPTTVGGKLVMSGGEETANCYSFNASTNEWKEEIPPLPKMNSDLVFASNEMYIVGCDRKGYSREIVVYSILKKKWFQVSKSKPKPNEMHQFVQPVIINNTAYFATNSGTSLFKLDLSDEKFSASNIQIDSYTTTSSKNPFEITGSLISLDGALACIGNTRVKEKFHHEEDANILCVFAFIEKSWLSLARLKEFSTVSYPACISLSDESVLVIGGGINPEHAVNAVIRLHIK